ncbi:Sterol uptake control protein 2 [Madurella mycetomatis]|uniref:Sterol uptake control protein 2 n=1 Tax=Madurella mycetomatis TaxID=100816 RepID=A0A150ASA9_9PEZI|nr:Sterol uptake control protein 2 [Madurella mycetomatis]
MDVEDNADLDAQTGTPSPTQPDLPALTASESASSTSTPTASGSDPNVRIRRRPIPRKGHTKSRRGCLNCKRRKVKCQENLPECSNCTRIGLVCQYPERRSTSPTSALSALSAPSAPPQSTPTIFTAEDMRYFHHFLIAAYPALPILADDVWRDVACLSHSYDYLMHAMLGLAASHLDLYGGNCSSQALAHRVKAIQSLNQALSQPCTSAAEGDARFAAMFALTFQASCMPEGMSEFLSLVRGCYILATTSMMAHEDSLFSTFTQEGYSDSVRRLIGTSPLKLDADTEILIDDFSKSLRALAPLCTSPLEIRFLAATERIVKVARVSAAEAFAQFASLYSLVNHASNEEFAPFADPENHSAQLLLIHFILIEFGIGHISLGNIRFRFAYRKKTCIAWMERLAMSLPDEYKKYAEWPMSYVRRLAAR